MTGMKGAHSIGILTCSTRRLQSEDGSDTVPESGSSSADTVAGAAAFVTHDQTEEIIEHDPQHEPPKTPGVRKINDNPVQD
jgi:hypothetical protein